MKDKGWIYISTFITSIGNGVFYITTSWFVYSVLKTSLAVGILMAFSLIPVILVFPFSGTIADRFNKKKIVVSMDIFRGIVIIVCAAVIYLSSDNSVVIFIYILTAMIKIGDCFFEPCIVGIIKERFSVDEYIKIFSANSTLQQIGIIVGSSITGILLSIIPLEIVLIIDALSFLFSALLLSRLSYTKKNFLEKVKGRFILNDLKSGIRYILVNHDIVFIIILSLVPIVVVNMLNTLLSAHTITTLGLDIKSYGVLDATFGVGCTIMGFLLSTITSRKLDKKAGEFGYLILIISLFGMSLFKTFWGTIVCVAFMGAGTMLVSINSKTLMAKRVSVDFIGRIDSYSYMINSVVTAILGILVGYLSAGGGTSPFFAIYGVGCLVGYFMYKSLIVSIIPRSLSKIKNDIEYKE